MTLLLNVKNLILHFYSFNQTIRAVRGVDLTISQGETIGLVGESGSGKSALAKSLTGLNPSGSSKVIDGEILYQGEDLLKKSENSMRLIRGKEIGMVFQDPMSSLNPTMRIGPQIGEGYKVHYPKTSRKSLKKKVLTLLEEVGISDPEVCYYRFPYELSGGMRQRAMIASAIIASPKILLADEPTTALDVTIQAQILDLLSQLQEREKMSILFITHDLSIAAQFCDRILVMYGGKIVEKGPTSTIFCSPAHPYTQALLDSIPSLSSSKKPLKAIPGSPPNLATPIPGCSFAPRCPHAMPICKKILPPFTQVKRGNDEGKVNHKCDAHLVSCHLNNM